MLANMKVLTTKEALKVFEKNWEGIEENKPGRVEALLDAIPAQSTDPEAYNEILEFWKNQVEEACELGRSKVFVNWDLITQLRWRGGSPCELPRTMKELERCGHIQQKTHYLNSGVTSRVGRWLWASVVGESTEISGGDYVVIPALQKQSEELLRRKRLEMHENSDRLTTMHILAEVEERENELCAEDLEVALVHLQRGGKCALEQTSDKDTLIKFQDMKEEKAGHRVAITDADRNVLSVIKAHHTVTKQVDRLTKKIEEEDVSVKEALKKQNKKRALGHLKQKKMLEGMLQQRMGYELNLHTILLKINEAHTQQEVMAAYKLGIGTLKSVMPDKEDVLETTNQLEEVFADQKDLEDALAGMGDAMGVTADQSELEAELDALVSQQTPIKAPPTPQKQPAYQNVPITPVRPSPAVAPDANAIPVPSTPTTNVFFADNAEIPTEIPAEIPENSKKSGDAGGSARKKTDEEELEELERMMADMPTPPGVSLGKVGEGKGETPIVPMFG
eukprot:comp17029_c0_seq1/m.15722 comp17029_c0_seq1/g.15722  ORF comp17029_c0_seq1/g.15722 comp17029_c0_seq1/m.15722 type:complete len:506 (-) comp17029_c0_seq1:104-1621(-)